jgi:uncharacterized protein (DUF58 family)
MKKINRNDLAQFGNLELLAKQVVEGFITGLHKSPFHGFSVEFAEHRLYNKGESTRHIDWKLFARTEKIFTKKYEEETNLRCQLVIDGSSSMYFPKDGNLNKYEFSILVAASLIELLKRQRDAVGLSIFEEKLSAHTSSKSSLAHHKYLYSLLEERLHQYDEKNKALTNTIQNLHDIAELCNKRSLIVIFTDLLDDPNKLDDLMGALQHMKHNKHEVLLFHVIQESKELNLEIGNRPFTFIDMETGEKLKLQPNSIKENYKKAIEKYFEEVRMRCVNYKIDFITADIDKGVESVLLSYLLKRQKLF